MSNLSSEQIENLKKDGYTITERGGKTVVEKETSSGTVRYNMEDGKVQTLDSYFGNVRDRDNHDRTTADYRKGGEISGHGYNHKKW